MGEDEEGYIYRSTWAMEKVKIPNGMVKCPVCKGHGEVRRYYGSPLDRGQFMTCLECGGKGFTSIEVAKEVNNREI